MENYLRVGDVFVVWRLDRLGRSLKNLISYVSNLESNGIGFHSISESINTEIPSGKFMLHVFGAPSEFERNLIKERTRAGFEAALVRGHQRRKTLLSKKKLVKTFTPIKVTQLEKFVRWLVLERLHQISILKTLRTIDYHRWKRLYSRFYYYIWRGLNEKQRITNSAI